MKSYFTQICMFAAIANARRSRRNGRRDTFIDNDESELPRFREPDMNKVVWDPLLTHDTLPFKKFMAPNEDDVDNFFMDWLGTYGG